MLSCYFSGGSASPARSTPRPQLQSTCVWGWLRPCIVIGSASALPILCVRCAQWERERYRERERERERERRKWRHLSSAEIGDEFCNFPLPKRWNWRWILHLSLPKISTLVLAKSFALFLAKNLHLSFSSLEGRWVHTFRCQKRCALRNSSRSSFCFCQMAWQGIEAPKQTIEFPAAPSFFSSKKWIKLIPKTIGNRKRDCAWGCARRINTTSENLQIEKAQISTVSGTNAFLICAFRSADFLRRCLSSERNLTHNLFFYFQ